MSEKRKHIKLENNPNLAENIFQVPEGYFEKLQNKLIEATEIEESELMKSKTLKKLPFEVPANYFEVLTEQIMEKTIGSETKVIPLYNQGWFKWTAVAATLVLAISFYFLLPQGSGISETNLASISNETIIEYLHIEDTSGQDIFTDVDALDLILDEIIAEELDVYADVLSINTELNYDFEYFDY